jgi:hypothetical protein
MRKVLLLAWLALLGAGCGQSNTSAQSDVTTHGTTMSTVISDTPEPMSLLVYDLDPNDGKLVAASVLVPKTTAVAAAALKELADQPASDVPADLHVTIDNGDAKVTGADLSGAALAQVVYTLTQFPTVKTVNGKSRADVEDSVPQILVERPTPGASVTSPLHVTGNANTFEATFQYKLLAADGTVLAKNFVTATSGTGTRGTFDFTVDFTVDVAQDGKLVVYENSAEDGSVIHERDIPLRLTP